MQTLNLEQLSEEWFAARCGVPSASEFSRFITPARGDYSKQARGYIAKLIRECVEGPGERMSTYWMDRGTSLEGEARAWYEFEFEEPVEQVGLILNRSCAYSPDGLLPNNGLLEIKCPKPETHIGWLLDGALPDEHKPQVHGGMVISDRDWLRFVSYCPGYRPLVVTVERDAYTAKVEKAVDTFVAEYAKAKAIIMAD